MGSIRWWGGCFVVVVYIKFFGAGGGVGLGDAYLGGCYMGSFLCGMIWVLEDLFPTDLKESWKRMSEFDKSGRQSMIEGTPWFKISAGERTHTVYVVGLIESPSAVFVHPPIEGVKCTYVVPAGAEGVEVVAQPLIQAVEGHYLAKGIEIEVLGVEG